MTKQYFLMLLARKLRDEISKEEEEQLQQIIDKEDTYRQIAEELTLYFHRKQGVESMVDDKLKKTWGIIAETEHKGHLPEGYDDHKFEKRRFYRSPLLKVAASIVLVVGLGLLAYHYSHTVQTPKFTTLTAVDGKLFKTLDDGTQIWLKKGSFIRYNDDFGRTKRELFLSGEAFFDVAKNKQIPLFVHAGRINIEVKGTAFNVLADKEQPNIEVSLIRGLVAVSNNTDETQKVILKPREKLLISFNGSINKDLFSILPMDVNLQLQEVRWTQDSLIFKKEKLKNLVLRLEKKYDVKIEINNEQLKDKRFSGLFADEHLKEALEALKLSYPFSYTITNKTVVIK
ncbi:DUF4974 domain-containing protein [Pedobacter hiemivivus]|uniref:DUF4974 domain-containing protein n=1 Tax=Pedobacter hiemivivus TaxID=2530454 RepID=A0A4R0MT13_9SPHI|nr:FecR domain-containing protein [Pedobacter hiemivivus]TCC89933.1 DUF4974 domain-containing protein [Pedobacter hiemivivus]TKC65480.1 DUF4974 domain-containing protein [Pedobacter hiemivivus]